MAFEIAHSKLDFDKLSPSRRVAAILLGVLLLLGLVCAGVTAYNVQPLDEPARQHSAASPGAA